MKKIFILWLLFGAYGISFAQIITITDFETHQPIDLVTLSSVSPLANTTTNSKGQANISNFKESQLIEIRMLGYRTEIFSYNQLKENTFNIRLTPGITMDGVVISATRWTESSRDIPSKITSISAKTVILQNPQTAADLLGASGEVFIQKSQQGGGSPMIRGFATNRLLYVIDGVRMNSAIFRSGNIQNVISLDPFATEKTEVFFGPGSVIYGSDAIGGVMSFQTLTPQLSLSNEPLIAGSAVTRFSSANTEKTAHFDVNVGWKKWASVTSFSTYDFADLRMGSNGPDEYLRPFYVQRMDSIDVVVTNEDQQIQTPTAYTQMNMMQKLRYKPNENWDIQYGFHYSKTSDYSRYDRHIRYKKGLPRYGEWYYGPQKWIMNNLSITNTGKTAMYDGITIRLAQQTFEESRIDRDINKDERHIRIEDVAAYSLNVDFNKTIGSKHLLYYGIEAVKNDVTSTGIDEDISTGISVPGPSRYPQSVWASSGAYLNYQNKLSKKVTLQAGLRYNQYSMEGTFDTTFYPFPYTKMDMNSGALTGSLGFAYHPSADWSISANASTGFRAPNVDDAGKVFDSEPGNVVVPNPDLKAEYAYNVEFGVAKVFGDVLKIDLTAYYTLLNDAMVRRDYTLKGMDSLMYDGTMSKVQAIQNAAVANVYGIQAGLEVKLLYGFGFICDFNYQKGEEELDDGSTSPSRHAAPVFGTSKLTFSAEKLNMQFYAIYSGKKTYEELPVEEQGKTEIYAIDDNGNPWSPSWYTLNFKAMYQLTDNFSVSAGLENITDQRYRPYSSGIVAPGRNFIISVRATL
ncbi:MAG: TonB-dependent receptor [Bacteroidales bacterium]|nr:TonB-dependent receptor [Bacteroidales bacterium]